MSKRPGIIYRLFFSCLFFFVVVVLNLGLPSCPAGYFKQKNPVSPYGEEETDS